MIIILIHLLQSYFMWDSFGVAVSTMRTSHNQNGENEFAEMEYMNITVVTSNEPYGIMIARTHSLMAVKFRSLI
jgi:hypothetical protein